MLRRLSSCFSFPATAVSSSPAPHPGVASGNIEPPAGATAAEPRSPSASAGRASPSTVRPPSPAAREGRGAPSGSPTARTLLELRAESPRSSASEPQRPPEVPLVCARSGTPLRDPVIGEDGRRYERAHVGDQAHFSDYAARAVLAEGADPEILTHDPIHIMPMRAPVIAADGRTYDLGSLLAHWLIESGREGAPPRSPSTGATFDVPIVFRNLDAGRALGLDARAERIDLSVLTEQVRDMGPEALRTLGQEMAKDYAISGRDPMARFRRAVDEVSVGPRLANFLVRFETLQATAIELSASQAALQAIHGRAQQRAAEAALNPQVEGFAREVRVLEGEVRGLLATNPAHVAERLQLEDLAEGLRALAPRAP